MQLPDIIPDDLRSVADEYVECFKNGDFNDDDLHDYIRLVLGYDVPRYPFCDNHVAPFQFIADIFFGRCNGGAAVGFANRGGGKTLGLAILENAGMVLRAPLEINHFGSVTTQSDICYDYFRSFAESEHLNHLFREREIQRTNTEAINGSSISIHPATMPKVSGGHPNWASLDEVETLERRGVIEKFRGMSQTSNGNHRVDIYTSTRDRAYGPFQKLLLWAESVGVPIYKWCIWEVLERCPPTRDCRSCPAWERCQGKARRTNGFYPLQDFIDRAATLDQETWNAQYLCLRPERTGAVYKEFDEDIHVSKEPIQYDPQHSVFLVGDPGWRAADKEKKRGKFVVADFQIDPYDRITVFRENRFIEKTPYDAGEIVARQGLLPWKGLIWDTEDPGGARDFIKGLGASVPIVRFDKGKIEPGIKGVRPFLKVRSDGTAGLLISKTCTDAIFEMLAYHYKDVIDGKPVDDKPEDVDDHFPDCLRYFVIAYQKAGEKGTIVGEVRDVEKILAGY